MPGTVRMEDFVVLGKRFSKINPLRASPFVQSCGRIQARFRPFRTERRRTRLSDECAARGIGFLTPNRAGFSSRLMRVTPKQKCSARLYIPRKRKQKYEDFDQALRPRSRCVDGHCR